VTSWATICTVSAMLYTFVVSSGHAQTQNQDQIAQRLQFINELCLSGKQYDLHADAKGNIVIKKLTPGSQGSATISQREAEGATFIYGKKLEIITDYEARECTKASLEYVLKFIKEESSKADVPNIKQKSSKAGTPNIGKSKRIDLSGLWLASGYICRAVVPEEKVRIQHIGDVVTAIKEKGDGDECIRSGEVTFTGKYDGTKTTIPVEMQMRKPNASTYPLRVSAFLEIVNSDSLVLVYSGIKITFERYK
jgi:hypothetical protein